MDTTFRTNVFNMTLVVFVGINESLQVANNKLNKK